MMPALLSLSLCVTRERCVTESRYRAYVRASPLLLLSATLVPKLTHRNIRHNIRRDMILNVRWTNNGCRYNISPAFRDRTVRTVAHRRFVTTARHGQTSLRSRIVPGDSSFRDANRDNCKRDESTSRSKRDLSYYTRPTRRKSDAMGSRTEIENESRHCRSLRLARLRHLYPEK